MFCLGCLSHGYSEGIVLTDSNAMEQYTFLTLSDFERHPLPMERKQKYEFALDYLDAFRKLTNQPNLEEPRDKKKVIYVNRIVLF